MNAKKLITLVAAGLMALAPALSQAQGIVDSSGRQVLISEADSRNASKLGAAQAQAAALGFTLVVVLVGGQKGTSSGS